MGEARVRQLNAGKMITLDLDAPDYTLSVNDRRAFSVAGQGENDVPEPSKVTRRCSRLVIERVMNVAFPQGMGRTDGKIWAAFQECLDDEDNPKIQTRMADFEWLLKHIANDDVKLPPAMAQWREELIAHMEMARDEVLKVAADA